MMRDSKDRSEDPEVARLARFSEQIAGEEGRLLHLLHMEYSREGAGGVWFQADPEVERSIPPWPREGEVDPLEEIFGPDADRIRLLTPEELEELRRGGDPEGVKPATDLTKPGGVGSPRPNTPSEEWVWRITFHHSDDRWSRIGGARPGNRAECGHLWILDFDYSRRVNACAGLRYDGAYRATLLRAIAEAYRQCREWDPQCPDARVWMLRAFWNCYTPAKGPTMAVNFKLAVACVAP